MSHFFCKKIILCLNSNQLLAGVWLGRNYQSSRVFTPDQVGQAAFTKFLCDNAAATFHLIADVAEEDYQFQHFPHTSGRTKQALLVRKLDQVYRGLAYKAATYYDREQNQARADNYLFVAIRHEKCMQPWLDLLKATDIKLAGIYLLSMLSEAMLRQHAQTIQSVLLCERLSSGLRHTFFMNGRLQMSRLVSDIAQLKNQWLDFYQTETEKTRMYLVSQRLIASDSPLDLMLFNIKQITSAQAQQQKVASYLQMDLSVMANILKLPLTEVLALPELMHMQLLVNGAKVANLAPTALTEKYHLGRLRWQYQRLGALLFSMCLGLSTYFYQQGLFQAATFKQLTPQLKVAEQRYQQEIRQSSDLNLDAKRIKTTVELVRQISDLPTSPVQMMQVLSSGFEVFSEAELQLVQLISFDWKLSTDKANNKVAWQETALVALEITGEADTLLQRYIENLRSNRHVMQVEVLPQVLDSEKQSAWHGNTAVMQERTTQKFKFKIVLKAKPKIKSAAVADRQP
jgi:hypothetical protein